MTTKKNFHAKFEEYFDEDDQERYKCDEVEHNARSIEDENEIW